MFATGSFVTWATAFRVGASWLDLWLQRTPPLTRRAVRASVGCVETGKAQAEFRDDLIALAREWAEVSWREMRRGIDDLDAFTRPDDEPAARPRRPNRVKP